jgi:DNA-binding GntR family transcriptional regulator
MRTPPRSARAVVTAQEAALNDLRDRIASGVLHPGEQLRQELLATEMGLSVVPVREALKTLEAEGQVVYAPHRGYFVARLDVRELTEAYRIRELLEDEAVTRGVPLLVDEDISRMKEAIEDIDRHSRANDIMSVNAANRRFHFTLFDAAEMPRLTNFIRILWEMTEPYRSLYIADAAHRRRVNDEHRAVFAAVCARDVAKVIQLLHEHRDNAMDSVKLTLAGDEAAE